MNHTDEHATIRVDEILDNLEKVSEKCELEKDYIEIKKHPNYVGLTENMKTVGFPNSIDLFAAIDDFVMLNSMGAKAHIPTGIGIFVPDHLDYRIYSNSELSVGKSIVTIDPLHRVGENQEEIIITLVNLSNNRFRVDRGMKIAQICFEPKYAIPVHVI